MTNWDAAWARRLDSELARLAGMDPGYQRYVRRELAKDPVAFAIIYLGEHLKSPPPERRISLSDVHREWAEYALTWRTPPTRPQEARHAFIAPREMGKSTWHFLILPLWAAANGLIKFAAAFAHSTTQAEVHLQTFKHELDTNALLRADYPTLCTPARRPSGTQVADRAGMLHTQAGFIFAARGIDSASLGLKVGHQRPDHIILDDIEPDEAKYSSDQAEKRLGTVTDAIFPLNVYARVTMVGTVTMPMSIMHQIVTVHNGEDPTTRENEHLRWIKDHSIQPHYHAPILTNDDGTRRSVWPEKWPLTYLESMEHTRSYAKNYLNDPMGRDGAFWRMEDFRYGSLGIEATRWILQLDPAVTTKDKSDWTGWAVVACKPAGYRSKPDQLFDHLDKREREPAMVEVVAAGQVKLAGEELRTWVLQILVRYPRIRAVRVEVNQGGELWHTVLHALPVKLLVHTSSEPKEIRFAWALDMYQTGGGRVLHREKLRGAEEQMVAYPRAPHDDIADAVSSGVLYFLRPGPTIDTSVRSETYV